MKGNKIALLAVVGILLVWLLVVAVFGRTLDGRVVDLKNGKPLAGAFVRIGNITTQTDNEGKFHRWGFISGSTEILVTHPAFLPATKSLVDVDLSKTVEVGVSQAGYEELLANAKIYLKSLDSIVLRTTSDSYPSKSESDKTKKYINRTENVMIYTPNTVWYTVQVSQSSDGKAAKQEVIVVGSDPNTPGVIKMIPGKPTPIVYIYESDKTGWEKFSILDRPDFKIPFPDKDPKEALIPLDSFGNTSEYQIIDDGSKTIDGEPLISCKMYWPEDSLLRGKSITYKFRKSNGNWYDISFFDNGANPASDPGSYSFTLLDDRPGLMVQLPKDAKDLKIDQQ